MGFIAKEGKLENLVSQWTVATILELRGRGGTER